MGLIGLAERAASEENMSETQNPPLNPATHEDVLALVSRLERRLKPIGWVWGLAAGLCFAAFYCGKLYQDVSSQIATQTVIQQQSKADLDAERKARSDSESAMLKTLNDLSTSVQLINQRLEDQANKTP